MEIDTLYKALVIFKTKKELEKWFGCVANIYKENKDYAVVKDFRTYCQNEARSGNEPLVHLEWAKKSYLLTAKDVFDDYMVYVEWNREARKRFWLPRRKILLPVVNDIQRLVDGDLDLLSISLPPGSGKTTIKNFLLSWQIGKNPDIPNLDSGHSADMTQSTYTGVLQILQDEEYLWHDVFPDVQDILTNAKNLTIDLNKPRRFSSLTCRSIGGSLTGATRCEGILSADDLVSGIEEAMSKERLDKKWSAYANDLKSRKKLGARELHIATRWSVNDVIGRLERQYEGDERAKFIVIPALNEAGESNFNYANGVGFDTKYFMDMKDALDEASFKALFMNEPIEREGLLYIRENLQRYYEVPEEFDAVLAVCDTAEGGGDDTVMPIFGLKDKKHYLIDCVCSSELPEITDQMCANALIRNRVSQCQFESNSAGGRTADKVQELCDEKAKNLGIKKPYITKKRTTANKFTKIIVNSSWVKENCLFLDDSKIQKGSQYADFINKMCTFTQTGKNKHDDVVDALAQYAIYASELVESSVKVVKRPF